MLIYIILLIMIAIYSLYVYYEKNSRQSKIVFLILSFTSMAFVIGLRGNKVGEDTEHYLNIFKYAANVKWIDIIHSTGMRTAYYTNKFGYTDTIENGFLALTKFVRLFTNDGHVFLFIVSGITCIFFAKFIYQNCEEVIFPTYIFLCESMFMLAFNGARQILAVSIAIQAYTFLKKKNWKVSIIYILIASLIHNVALVCFALFPIMMIKSKREHKIFKYAIVATIAMPFAIILAQSAIINIFPRYRTYFELNFWTNSIGGIAILWCLELMLIILQYKKKFRYENSFSSSCLVLLYLACELVGLRITMFSRVGWFFRPYLMIFFPNCSQYFTKKTWLIIKSVIIVLMFLLYFSYARTPARAYSFCWK